MAEVKITIPDNVVNRVINAFCTVYRRPDTVVNAQGETVDNPTSKAEFTRNIVKSFMHEVMASHEGNIASEAARIEAINKAKTEVVF